MTKCIQETFAPHNQCFGCGTANDKGLRIRSFVSDDGETLLATFEPEDHHQAFGNVLNGGIIGALLDCHSNWAAAHALMVRDQASVPPCTVTADFHVKLRRPTPMDVPIALRAKASRIDGDKAIVEATLAAGGKVTATCTGTFVAVQQGHPAFHRWSTG